MTDTRTQTTCQELTSKLDELRLLVTDMQDLHKKLLEEGSNAVPKVREDFRKKRNEIKDVQNTIEGLTRELQPKDTPELIKKLLTEIGTPATLDESFEGGIVNIELNQKVLNSLSTFDTAKKAYQEADNGSPSYIFDGLDGIPYTKPNTKPTSSLDILVLNHGETSPQERDKLVEDMDTAGYRPLEFSELIALGVLKPELNKRNEVLNTYKKYALGGELRAPYLNWDFGRRILAAGRCDDGWLDGNRFLFVRK